jgi:hypothetical protein
LYGLTASQPLKDPAAQGLEYLKTLKMEDPPFLLWKGIAVHAAHEADLPGSNHELCDQIANVLEKKASPLSIGGAYLLAKSRNQQDEHVLRRLSEVAVQDCSAMEAWVMNAAMTRAGTKGCPAIPIDPWKILQGATTCEMGSWHAENDTFQQRLETTLFLTLERECVYRYRYVLFSAVPER